jgi:hypothetical protein
MRDDATGFFSPAIRRGAAEQQCKRLDIMPVDLMHVPAKATFATPAVRSP